MGQNKKIGLVLEGGAMRGMYTAGILDVFMEQGIESVWKDDRKFITKQWKIL